MPTRQAVVLIHGIGEQRPMDTLRGFVDAVWVQDTAIHDPHAVKGAHTLMWSKPDTVSDSFELRRLTTPRNSGGARTDFIEFYWAHMMKGTNYGHLFAWARSLLLRRPSTVPPQLKLAYWLSLIAAALALSSIIYAMWADAGTNQTHWNRWLSVFASLVLLPAVGFIAKNVVGDAARYLHVAPANVQRRHEIRKAGVALIKALHDRGYDRIIVVGHSLGSVIGYDILTHAWMDYHAAEPTAREPSTAALDALEAAARSDEPLAVDRLQMLQHAYLREVVANGNRWRVTDFITLGSPLAHAPILMATSVAQLSARQADREFPTCPPALETVTRNHQEIRRFSFETDRRKADSYRIPHHAAVFGPTRWSNLYFPNRMIVVGDLVGGPLAHVFGRGIHDVSIQTTLRHGLLSHTLYWQSPTNAVAPAHIIALRRALDLTSRGD
jgi:hypothetical protein